jgi:hypothetical protein
MADEPNLVEMITALGEALRSDLAKHCADMTAKYDALDAKMKKADEGGHRSRGGDQMRSDDGDNLAEKVAADRRADSVSRAEYHALQDQLKALQIAQPARQSSATRDQMADAQSRADVAYRALGESAPQPMSGEGHLDYLIRLHRPLQKHSKKFKAAELHVLARDPSTLNSVLDQIRADAVEVGISPVGMPMFQHREIVETLPTGHISRKWVGNGTIFRQLSRPVRHVHSFNVNDKMGRSAGGAILAAN